MRTRTTIPALATTLVLGLAACGTDAEPGTGGDATWELPGEQVFPEGIAVDGEGEHLYVGSTDDGAVYRGRVDDPAAGLEVFLEPGDDRRTTVTGLFVDDRDRLWVAGRDSNLLFVHDADDGSLLRSYEPPAVERTLLNDVVVTDDAAYVTDSFRPTLFRVPLTGDGALGELEPWLDLRDAPIEYGDGFNLNGIVATPDGATLLTVDYATGELFRIDAGTGGIEQVDLGGQDLRTGDGMVLDGELLHVVLGGPGEVVTLELDEDLLAGEVVARTSEEQWRAPTTIAPADEQLLVVNSQLDMTGGDEQPELPFTVSAFPIPTPTQR